MLLLDVAIIDIIFWGGKLLHHLEISRMLKGKVKKDEGQGWNATRGPMSVRYVLHLY